MTRFLIPYGPPDGLADLEELGLMPAHELETEQPVQKGRCFVNDTQRGIRSGIWQATPYSLKRKVRVATEFAVLLEGAFTIVSDDGVPTTVEAGDACVLLRGLGYKWTQSENVRKYYMSFSLPTDGNCDAPRLQRVTRKELREGEVDFFVSGEQRVRIHTDRQSGAEGDVLSFAACQFVMVLEGKIDVEDCAQQVHRIEAGAAFYIPVETTFRSLSAFGIRSINCTLC
ncbi:cupin domain-containing protein [Pseudorhodoplanes sp.]|uniref:cupin domain-containing protein n=1 Tax=Pseudorhodoplanes sp. TaxID=1934341 RepID=UPI003D0EAB68